MKQTDKTINAKRETIKKLSPFFSAAGLIVIAAAVFFIYNYINLTRVLYSVSPGNDTATNAETVKITIDNSILLNSLEFFCNGTDITDKLARENDIAGFYLEDLPEGKHTLYISSKKSFNIMTLIPQSRSISFEVDRTPPELILEQPAGDLISKREVDFTGRTKPGSLVTFNIDERVHQRDVDKDGNFHQKLIVEHEINDIEIVSKDRAGNTTTINKRLIYDENPPEIVIIAPENEQVVTTTRTTLRVQITDEGSGVAVCYFEIDGEKIEGTYDKETNILTAQLNDLDEGFYDIKVYAEDRAGWKSQETWGFTVDARAFYTGNRMRPGALGEDVRDIQRILVKRGLLTNEQATGVYGTLTTEAIMTVQEKAGLPLTGILDFQTFLAMSSKIYVFLDEFALYLVSHDDKVLKRYPVAIGNPSYPTPPGRYFVTDMIYNPPWYPPDSPWAKDAKITPPGPDNPLGTRWIGLSANILGIHGTPAAWSIGTAASHGCIRMYISDVEELFEMVDPGVPVKIFQRRSEEHKNIKTSEELKKG
jgi:hypothetical protein